MIGYIRCLITKGCFRQRVGHLSGDGRNAEDVVCLHCGRLICVETNADDDRTREPFSAH